MFTIKWIASNGYEHLYRGADVRYVPASAQNEPGNAGHNANAKAIVEFDIDGDVRCSIDSGEVYVMNESGKTVANYVLSTDTFPHGLAPRQAA